jgi:hypothetical protein
MKLYQGTRWWLVCPCLVLIVVGCVVASMKRTYSPDESRVIFNYLSQKHASEQEVIDFLGHQSKVVTHPAVGKPIRIYYFSRFSQGAVEAQESWAIYNEDGKLQHFVSASQILNGLALWKYRFGLFSLYGN